MIKIIKNFFKTRLKDLYINHTYKKILRDHRVSNYISKSQNKILENNKNLFLNTGVIELPNYLVKDNYFEYFYKLNKKIELKKLKNFPIYSHPIVIENDTIFEKILLDKKLTYLIKSYLGNDAILDYVSLSITIANSSNKIISEKWHFDNVGRRLKLFFYLNSNSSISTDYVLGTNKIMHNSYTIKGSRIPEYKISKYKKDIKKFFPQKGHLILFDTNGYHRGNYSENTKSELNDHNNSRFMIKMEFSSKSKSEKFFEKSKIIGPRNTFFSKGFDFESCELIDKSFLTNIGDTYFYDKSFSDYR